ncbi:TRAP transporter small permease subunit [uncultured Tateyamaria sp.]|uniref:TRAP transporter small permease n=1 Tax=uncultured Tateyamaria sp. TaxID=455651 RepID=UPI0026122AAE|nr:TRAP transporter small permease subunit [uncultured Tateyamaria sp.]
MLFKASAFWARIEMFGAAAFAVCVTLLILLNVVTRNVGQALFWVDELAIYAMVWMTFLGASAALHHRSSVSISLISDSVSPALRRMIGKFVDTIVFAFSVMMLWFCWRWFLPLDLIRSGFDVMEFQGSTFNFIYAEPTLTVGLPKYLFWLVMWLFSLGATLHSVAHLVSGPKPEDAA